MVTRSPFLTLRVRRMLAIRQTSSCSCLYVMCFDCEGSSPSQMIAVWLPRLARWRSMQFQATFSTPSSNHLMEMLPGAKEEFSILVGAFIQSRRLACSPQKPLGSETERAYISLYFASSTQARFAQSADTS